LKESGAESNNEESGVHGSSQIAKNHGGFGLLEKKDQQRKSTMWMGSWKGLDNKPEKQSGRMSKEVSKFTVFLMEREPGKRVVRKVNCLA